MVDVFDECGSIFIGLFVVVVDCQWVLVYGDFVIWGVSEVECFVQCGQFVQWLGCIQVVDEVYLFLCVLVGDDLVVGYGVGVGEGNMCGIDVVEVV